MTFITECLICKRYKKKGETKYYTPTEEERRSHYFNDVKLSHGYCLVDFVAEIEKMVKSAEEIK